MFNTEIHLVTFIILLLQLSLFPFQIMNYLSRVFDKQRLRVLILNIVYFQYNLFSGLFPDPDLNFPSIFYQNIIAYLVGIILAIYYVRYIYLYYSIKPLALLSVKQVIIILLVSFTFLFITPYLITKNLNLSRKLFIIIPLIFCLLFSYKIVSHFFKLKSDADNYIKKYFKGKTVLGYLSIISFTFLPIMVFVGDYQYIEQPIVNISFFTLALSHMSKIIYESRIENEILYEKQKITFEPNSKSVNFKLNDYNLTRSELDVAMLILKGVKYKEIAANMFISYNTVTKHASNIFKKIGVKSKKEFLDYFL